MASRRRRELAWIFAVVFGAVSGGANAALVPFDTHGISAEVDGARFVQAADIDGDGDLDGVSVARYDDAIYWHENENGDGSSWGEPQEIFVEPTTFADTPYSVFPADIDGDGDVDVLSSALGSERIRLHLNSGDGSGWASSDIIFFGTAADPVLVSAADVDGDGDLDALAAWLTLDAVVWYDNTAGDGSAWTARTIGSGTTATGADGASSVFAADLDGDGDLDVAFAANPSGTAGDKISWYENLNGTGTSWSHHTVFTTPNGPASVFAADVDGDGDLDLASASLADDGVRWHENLNGAGTSWSTATISTAGDQSSAVFVADVDGDGDLDVLSSSRADDEVSWSENMAGDGSSWGTSTLSTLADRPYSVFAADVDGDGDVDALSASLYDDTIRWYENRTIHRSALLEEVAEVGTTAFSPLSVFAGDVDGDGDLDALSASIGDDEIAWYENADPDGDGTSWAPFTIASGATAADGAYSVFAADVDGDGDLDALSAAANSGEIAWWSNGGDGTAWTKRLIDDTAVAPIAVFAADIDGDGDIDALSAASTGNDVVWHENENGAGTSWTAHTISSTADEAAAVFAADVDGDGDLDVLSASADDDKIAWYENENGDGSSWGLQTISTTLEGTRAVFAGDVDGDGDVDALSGSVHGLLLWFENADPDGGGTSWIAHTIATGGPALINIWSVFAADLDGDADLDLLAGFENTDRIAWYENADPEGDGTSWAPHTIATTIDRPRAVVAGDVDGDGDLDVLTASQDDDTIAWYPNEGGQYAIEPTALAQGVLANSQEDVAFQLDFEHRGRAGDSDVELAVLGIRLQNSVGFGLTGGEANALVESIEIFLDDGSGSFEFPGDTLVASVATITPSGGNDTISVGGPDAELSFGETKRFFLVITMTDDASVQVPNELEIELFGGATAVDASVAAVLVLRQEPALTVATGLIDTELTSASCTAPFELDLIDFTVTSAVVCEAGTVLSAGDGLTVSPTGDLTLKAGQRVRFVTDFSVKSGGELATTIDPSLEP